MIDVALASLIEDMIEKAGADGVVEFWQRVGDNLASRMGKEAYLGWTSFNVAVREGRTAFSIEGDVTPLTDMAITDVDGDVAGYLYAMRQCCYVPTIFRTRFAVGRMSPADKAVTEEYNENVHNIAVCNLASLNIAAHIENKEVQWSKLEETVRTAIRHLDNLIDIVMFPSEAPLGLAAGHSEPSGQEQHRGGCSSQFISAWR